MFVDLPALQGTSVEKLLELAEWLAEQPDEELAAALPIGTPAAARMALALLASRAGGTDPDVLDGQLEGVAQLVSSLRSDHAPPIAFAAGSGVAP